MDGTDAATRDRAARIPGEATRLVDAAAAQSLLLRITGSVAVHLHCAQHRPLMGDLGRRPFYDIDFWGRDRDHQLIDAFFQAQGYQADPAARGLREWGIKRQIFGHPDTGIKIDVFMDTLVMAHSIKFLHRLELADPCVPVADLVLSKLQIHEITTNDLIDLTVLFGEHAVVRNGSAAIDLDRILDVLCDDWGFWYTADQNLASLHAWVERPGIDAEVRGRVQARIEALRTALAEAPKTRRWRLRAKIGVRKRWYEPVEQVS
ncbi:hypothetical protein MMAD_31350 [Mycolicibacterium madagascariense]|uniref:Uncharacterized protein n=1 Tax=Mycolicibacterium madagascariense TaxID=212765 RepID=A0A7I7XI27_9MYCO|nr:hypothetical protein [Mycolicibacterium madagascariense]MCV7015795.1 hypothetical protein [Mycolicibacterium madagascariense]BBZ28840.1 hypothetical protein MMAD_31350 [Mycolicibacterium madagascariense]